MERDCDYDKLYEFLRVDVPRYKGADGRLDAAFPLAKSKPYGLPSSPPDRFRFVYEQAIADGANEVQAIGVAVEAVQPSEDVED